MGGRPRIDCRARIHFGQEHWPAPCDRKKSCYQTQGTQFRLGFFGLQHSIRHFFGETPCIINPSRRHILPPTVWVLLEKIDLVFFQILENTRYILQISAPDDMQITLGPTRLGQRNSYMERKEDREKLHLGEAVDQCAGGPLTVATYIHLLWALSVWHCGTERNCRDPKVSQPETLTRIGARDISLLKNSLALFLIVTSLTVYHST